jgi:tetratricopeptide (TPR) repeat protein
MKGFGDQNKLNKHPDKISKTTKPSKQQIYNQAIQFHAKGNITEAAKYYQYFINQGFEDYGVFSNYGVILKSLGKLKEAEFCYRKAIKINPDFYKAHFNLGNVMKDLGKLKEAKFYYLKAIEINPDFADAYSNLGNALRNLGNLDKAEIAFRKAIKINPNFAIFHSNLGGILKDLGKLKEAESSCLKAIEINPDYARAYFSISNLKYSNKNKKWKENVFSESILINKSRKDQIDIYFARANVLHNEKNYNKSAKNLKLANDLKLGINPSNTELILNKSKSLLCEIDKIENIAEDNIKNPQSIFIVGMPRCGSTLLESILSRNNNVDDLGEIEILEELYLESKKSDQSLSLAKNYWKKIKDSNKNFNITTNKNLFNYQYTGIIAKKIPNAKIIHCFRNPLDNILSLYRAHFAKGIEYSSSLADSAKVYLDQETIMTEYKNRFRTKIYDLNYDSLVTNPEKEIRSLISWIGWQWEDMYLSPHLNSRSVLTRSNVQVRYPINSKSIGNWKNYKELLQPAIEIIIQNNKYKNLIS